MRAVIAIAGLLAVFVAGPLLLKYGTLSPCGMLRAQVREHDGFAAVLPDGLADLGLAAHLGALTPAKCLAALFGKDQSQPPPKQEASKPPPTPSAPALAAPSTPSRARDAEAALRNAFQKAGQATAECRARRLSGELKGFVESVECATPGVVSAFAAAGVSEELVSRYSATRLDIAQKLDRKEYTLGKGDEELRRLEAWSIHGVEVERRRSGP